MALREIVLYPDARLREPCEPIEHVTEEVRALLDDMAETMYAAPGIGLAAPQIGVQLRAIVVDVGDDEDEEGGRARRLYKLVNPEIVSAAGKVDSEEGCLSIPAIRESIKRSEEVIVEALDEKGEPVRVEADGLFAIALQHEIDHLNGVLFIDHLSRLKRQMVKAKLKKQNAG